MKKIVIFLGLIALVSAIYLFFAENAGLSAPSYVTEVKKEESAQNVAESIQEPYVKIGDDTIFVDIADEDTERVQGLSGRTSLANDRGMLFLFEKADRYGFWMKGMKFPLDIIWIKNDTIVGFSEDLQPDNSPSPQLYYSPVPVDKVLEINVGQVKELALMVGDRIEFLLK